MRGTFYSSPLWEWKHKGGNAGRVRVIEAFQEDMYFIYDEVGHYIGAIHEDCLHNLLQLIPKETESAGDKNTDKL